MTPPKLTRALTLQDPGKTPDGHGGYTTSWTSLGLIWADLRLKSPKAAGAVGTPVARQMIDITLRAAPVGDPRRPKPGQRFVMGSQSFAIDAVGGGDAGGKYLICTCREEVTP